MARRRYHNVNFTIVSFGETTHFMLNFRTKYALNKTLQIIRDYYAKNHKPLTIQKWKELYYNTSPKKTRKLNSELLFKLAAFVPEGRTKPYIRFINRKTKFNPIKIKQIIKLIE